MTMQMVISKQYFTQCCALRNLYVRAKCVTCQCICRWWTALHSSCASVTSRIPTAFSRMWAYTQDARRRSHVWLFSPPSVRHFFKRYAAW